MIVKYVHEVHTSHPKSSIIPSSTHWQPNASSCFASATHTADAMTTPMMQIEITFKYMIEVSVDPPWRLDDVLIYFCLSR